MEPSDSAADKPPAGAGPGTWTAETTTALDDSVGEAGQPLVIPEPPTLPTDGSSTDTTSDEHASTDEASSTDEDSESKAPESKDPDSKDSDSKDPDSKDPDSERAEPRIDPNATVAVTVIDLDPPKPVGIDGAPEADTPTSDDDDAPAAEQSDDDNADASEAESSSAPGSDTGSDSSTDTDTDADTDTPGANDEKDEAAGVPSDDADADSTDPESTDPESTDTESTDTESADGEDETGSDETGQDKTDKDEFDGNETSELPAGAETSSDPTTPMPVAEQPGATVETPGPATANPGRRLGLIAVGALAGLYLLVTAAWAVDAAAHRGQAMRGVHIDDIDVGGDDRDEMAAAITTLTDRLAGEELEVTVGQTSVTTDPVTLGTVPDSEPMIDEALAARRGGFLPLRPISWVGGLFSRHTVAARYTVDPVESRRGVADVVEPELDLAVEPTFEFNDQELEAVSGATGVTVDPETVIEKLPAAIAAGSPFQLEVPELEAPPELSDESVEDLVAELNEQTSEAITVRVLDKEVSVSPNSQRSWIEFDGSDGEVAWAVDEDTAMDELRPLFPVLGSEDQQARFEVIDEEPIIIPAAETVVCCADGAGEILTETIASPLPVPAADEDGAETDDTAETGDGEEAAPRVAELAPEITGFDEGVEELESLGIIELVSTFTTNHACCQNRVKNIQRFADLTQGAIVRPGEDFSLNGFVGRRTTEKGFFPAGAIALGNFEDQVGGGISQYATTFFNASFYAGLEFLEYQSHSIYISRYPRGREATISWPAPDLHILNNTPYGILIWNDYTESSITVSFYSTKHLEVEDLPLKRSSDRQCRIDITPRLITYEDGTTFEDSVRAIYRPGEGLDCNGNSTTPEEDVKPDPKPEPEPDPEPQPDPEPDPDPGGDDGDGGDGEVLPPD